MNKTLIKDISFYVGIIAVFVAGMLYVLLGDWILTTQSLWLMLAAILSIGSAVFVALSEKFRESHGLMYTFKGIAMGLSACLIVYFIVYLTVALAPAELVEYKNKFEESFAIKSVAESKREIRKTLAVFIVVLVLDVFALIAQALNTVLTVTIKEE